MTVIYNGVKLEHKGAELYADGVAWAFIGERERRPSELVAIYLKYCDASAGR